MRKSIATLLAFAALSICSPSIEEAVEASVAQTAFGAVA